MNELYYLYKSSMFHTALDLAERLMLSTDLTYAEYMDIQRIIARCTNSLMIQENVKRMRGL